MRIVEINSVIGIGSTGRIVVDIGSVLAERGVENYILYGIGSGDERSRKIGGPLNVKLHQVGTRLLGKHGFYSKSATRKAVKDVNNLDPDIIHLHNIHGHYLNVEILFNYLHEAQTPIVWTLHDCWSFTGHCAYFDYVGCDKWRSQCHKCPQLRSYPKSLIFDRSMESFGDKKRLFTGLNNLTLVTPSKWLKDLVSKSFLSQYRTIVINNGIDLGVFSPKKGSFRERLGLQDKFVVLGIASSWEPRKGLRFFTDISRMMTEEITIVLVGVTDKVRRSLPRGIIAIPRTNNARELAEVYSEADVFVNPTLEDNFPTTNLEALACGTPVITFDTGGSPEAIDDQTGLVVEKGNAQRLYEAILTVKKMGKPYYIDNCRERARSRYDKADAYNSYLNLYKEIIRSKN